MGISAFINILCLLNYQYWSAAFASIFSYPVYSNKYMKSSELLGYCHVLLKLILTHSGSMCQDNGRIYLCYCAFLLVNT